MRSTFTIVLLLLTHALFAQTDTVKNTGILPVPVEAMVGNKRFILATRIVKNFTPQSNFNILSVTNAANDYQNNLPSFDFINVTQVAYNVYKGIGLDLGVSINNLFGFSPTLGIQYVYHSSEVLLVIAPDVFLTNDHNIESIVLLEYTPKITTNWSLYTRQQGFYNHDSKADFHQRSYYNTRIGLSTRQVTFGLGGNFDWYGPRKTYKNNFGAFIIYSFF